MELQEYDIVIRQLPTSKESQTPHHRLVIIGHEDEMTFEGDNAVDCLRQMNWALYNRSYARRLLRDVALGRLRKQLRKDAGIRWYHFGTRKAPGELRNRMNDVVATVCKEYPKFTYEQTAQEVLRRWNECDRLGNIGHECSADCTRRMGV